jgi:DNA-binding MarR family transcriptional regulator
MASAPGTDRAGPKVRASTGAAAAGGRAVDPAGVRPAPVGRAAARPAGFYRPDRYSADESVGYLMRRVLNGMAQATELRLEPHGLTNAQWMPLFKLRLGAAQTVAELARECQADAGAMTRMLDRLEAKGLCRRVRSTADRRVVNIELTPDGEKAADKVPPAIADVLNGYLAGFTREEWEVLKSLLRRMLGNADTARALR